MYLSQTRPGLLRRRARLLRGRAKQRAAGRSQGGMAELLSAEGARQKDEAPPGPKGTAAAGGNPHRVEGTGRGLGRSRPFQGVSSAARPPRGRCVMTQRPYAPRRAASAPPR